ncbi:MAG: hypothetical protein ACYTG7_11040 [Planctomycetota bacterium]
MPLNNLITKTAALNALGAVLIAVVVLLGLLSFAEEFFVPLFVASLVCIPPLWTFIHARSKGVKSAVFWTFLALFANVIGMILYYICTTRHREDLAAACPLCQGELRDFLFCGSCGSRVSSGWKYCPECATSLEA